MHRIVTAVIIITMALVLSSCDRLTRGVIVQEIIATTNPDSGDKETYEFTFKGGRERDPAASLSEGSQNSFEYIMNPDTGEIILRVGQDVRASDSTPQIRFADVIGGHTKDVLISLIETAIPLAEASITSGATASIGGLFGDLEISAGFVESLKELLAAMKQSSQPTEQDP